MSGWLLNENRNPPLEQKKLSIFYLRCVRIQKTNLWKLIVDILSKFESIGPRFSGWTTYHTAYFVDLICLTACTEP